MISWLVNGRLLDNVDCSCLLTLTNPCLFIQPVLEAASIWCLQSRRNLCLGSPATGSEQEPGPGLVLSSPVSPCSHIDWLRRCQLSHAPPPPPTNPRIRNVLTQMLPVLQRHHALRLSRVVVLLYFLKIYTVSDSTLHHKIIIRSTSNIWTSNFQYSTDAVLYIYLSKNKCLQKR